MKLNIKKLKLVIPFLLIVLISAAFRLYDITNQFEVWDEYTVVRYGENYLNFIRKNDFSKDSWSLNKEHPPFSKYFYGASRIVSLNVPLFRDQLDTDYPVGRRYTFQRIISAFIGVLSVIILYLFVKEFLGKKSALLSSVFLGLNTYHIAHSRIATQENLVCFLTLTATYLFYKAVKSDNLFNLWYLGSGVFLGLAISTKYNALFFIILFAVIFVLAKWKILFKNRQNLYKNYAILTPLIAVLILILIWPWLWSNPISQFLASTATRVDPSRAYKPSTEYFLGVYPHNSPWYYFFVYFLATTHPVYALGLIFFIIKVTRELLSRKLRYDFWFLLYFLTPFLATFSPLKMDGIRYIFTIFPALSVISAIGTIYLIKLLKEKLNFSFEFRFLIISGLIYALIQTNLNFYPFYLDYYNDFYGGTENVYNSRLFDFGYWGEGLRDAVRFINSDAKTGDIVRVNAVPLHVLPTFREGITQSHLGNPNYIIVNPTGEWLNVADNSPKLNPKDDYKVVFEEKLFDVPMVQVLKLQKSNTKL